MSSRPDRQLSIVVLPEPDGPMTATSSPRADVEVDVVERDDFAAGRPVELPNASRDQERFHTGRLRRVPLTPEGSKVPAGAE